MNRQHHDQSGPAGIPLSVVYRQLDDIPAPGAERYDPAAAVARLMTRWTSDGTVAPAGVSPERQAAAAAEMFRSRSEFVLHLARRRMLSAWMAFAAVLGIGGIAAAAIVLIRDVTTYVLAGIGVAAVSLAFTVVLIHRVTMLAMAEDHRLVLGPDSTVGSHTEGPAMRAGSPVPRDEPVLAALSRDDDDVLDEGRWAAGEPLRRPPLRLFRSATALVAGTATALALHGGSTALIAAALAGTAFASLLVVAVIVLSSAGRSERAVNLIMALNGQHARLSRRGTRRSMAERALYR